VNTRVDTPAETPPDDECQRQLHKTLQSANFRSASMLQQLLRYLTDKSFARSTEVLKEYTIGVEALGRPLDFDPKADPIVRVQIHRLRQKLKEYFDSDGLQDGIVIEIPKGQHLPVFRYTFNANPDSRSETASENDCETSAFAQAAFDGCADCDSSTWRRLRRGSMDGKQVGASRHRQVRHQC
jgi:hypothetical protein